MWRAISDYDGNERGARRAKWRVTLLVAASLPLAGLAIAILLGALIGLAEGPAGATPAAVCTWSGATSGDWSVGSNWTSTSGTCTNAGGPPAGAALVFPSGASTLAVTFDAGTETGGSGTAPATTFDSIDFEAAYTISEGAGAPVSMTLSPTAATAGCGASTTVAVCQAAAGTVTFQPGITLGTTGEEVAAAASGRFDATGVVSGPSMDMSIGDAANDGVVLLDPQSSGSCAVNTYSGTTTVAGGTLGIACPAALGNGSGAVAVDAGSTLVFELTSNGTIANSVTDNSSTAPAGVSVCPASAVTTTFSGTISGSGDVSTGGQGCSAGTVVLDSSGGDTYAGGTTVSVSGSSLVVEGATSDELAAAGSLAVDAGTTFDMNGRDQAVAGFSGSGTVDNGATGTTATLTDTAGTTSFSGVIEDNAGTGGVVAVGVAGAALTLSGANTYSAGTAVTSGEFASSSAKGFGTGEVTVGNGATIALKGGSAAPANLLELQGTLEDASGGDGWAGTIQLGSTPTIEDAGSGNFSVSGALTGSTGLSISCSGAGMVELSSDNAATLSGAVSVPSGGVAFAANGAIGTGAITVSSGAFVDLAAGASEANTLDVAGDGTGGGALVVAAASGQGTWAGPVQLGGATTFAASGSQSTLTVSGAVSGAGPLATAGPGTVVLGHAASYSGSTTVSSGTLAESVAALPAATSLDVAAGATFDLGGQAQQVASILTGSGTITSSSPGAVLTVGNLTAPDAAPESLTGTLALVVEGGGNTLALSGTNSYTGGTTVSSGILDVAGTAALGASSGAVTVASGATIELDPSFSGLVANPLTLDGGELLGASTVPGANGWSGPVHLGAGATAPVLAAASGQELMVEGALDDGGAGRSVTIGSAGDAGTVALEPLASGSCTAGAYSGGTMVTAGSLALDCPAAAGASAADAVSLHSSTALIVAMAVATDAIPNDISFSGTGSLIDAGQGATLAGTIDLGSPDAVVTITEPSPSRRLTLAGAVTGGQNLDVNQSSKAQGSVVLAGADDTYTGSTTVESGVLDVTGVISASAVTVQTGAVLEGIGTVAAIDNDGEVHPGTSLGTLTATGAVTLASGGSPSLSVDITGANAGSGSGGFSQFVADGGTVDLTGAALDVNDTFDTATYGEQFQIVGLTGGATETGIFTGLADGSVVSAGTRKLVISYSATGVVLTDVTNPPPPLPAVTSVTPDSGPQAGGTSVTVTGNNFVPGATTVAFGSDAATGVTCASATTCVAISPAGTGTVEVTVATAAGTSAITSGDQFTYTAPPTVIGYHALAPARICDTRASQPANQCTGHPLAGGGTQVVTVAGNGGVPAPGKGVTAVVLNVTAAHPTEAGYFTVWPDGQVLPVASSLNFHAGVNVPNLVTVALPTDGKVDVHNAKGTVDLIVDVEGYYAPEATAGTGLYNALTPARICDTRSSQPANQCTAKAPAPGSILDVTVAGRGGVPASGAAAVVLNVTAIGSLSPGYLTVYPQGATRPTASNVNYAAGEDVPNRVMVPLGTGGAISIYSGNGSPDIAVDVSGYFTDGSDPSATGAEFTAATSPIRICDTRMSQKNNQCTSKTLMARGTLAVTATGLAGVPPDATAVVLNVTAADETSNGYLTVFPSGATMPVASDVNFTPSAAVANMTVATLGSAGAFSVYNSAGSTDLVVDLVGWYS